MSALSLATMRLLVAPPKKEAELPLPPLPPPPSHCPNGYTIHENIRATEGQPRPVGGEAHVAPRNTSGEYLMPVPSCGDLNQTGPGTRKPCIYCQSSNKEMQAHFRRSPLDNDAMVKCEAVLGRRMTFQEAYMVYCHLVNYGPLPAGADKDPIKSVWRQQCLSAGTLTSRLWDSYVHAKRTEKAVSANERVSRMQRERPMVSAALALSAFGAKSPDVQLGMTDARPTDRAAYVDREGELPCGHTYYNPSEYSADDDILSQNCDCPIQPSWPVQRPRNRSEGRDIFHGVPFKGTRGNGTVRLVGVEVECNHYPTIQSWLTKWRGALHQDGSCGYEAVTTPVAGEHVKPCLTDLTDMLKAQGNTADNRCGVHVHVDARDIQWPSMLRLLRVYTLLEPILYLIGGQNRLSGRYCAATAADFRTALAGADPKTAVLAAAFRGGLGRNRERSTFDTWNGTNIDARAYVRSRPGKKDAGRYRGINIIPWIVGRRTHAPDTTIEFRMHRNSLDGARIAEWARLLATIVDWCDAATDGEVAALPRSALRALVNVIAPAFKPWVMSRVKGWRKATTPCSHTETSEAGVDLPCRHIKLCVEKNAQGKAVWSCAV